MKSIRCVLSAGLLSLVSCVQTQGVLEQVMGTGGELDTSTIEAGLREALRVGIGRTVDSVGREDGYFRNPDIRIGPPETIEDAEAVIRGLGYGPALDEFELSMNRAAEAAAPLAIDIFADAISQMTIVDARQILQGDDTEATAYLRAHSIEQLTSAFAPVVRETMSRYGVVQRYQAVTGGLDRIPGVSERLGGGIEEYTVRKSLDGLFFVLAQEEKRIRENPTARTTELLRKVFGRG